MSNPSKQKGRGSHPNSRANLNWNRPHGLPDVLARTVAGPGCCVLFTGPHNRKGYGQKRIDGKTVIVHRYIYEQLVGPIPTGLTLDHTCEVKHCVNPRHLEPVTLRENVQRYYARGDRRVRRGEQA